MTAEIGVAGAAPQADKTRLSLSAWSWASYEGARDPAVILIFTYSFVPYFATVVVGDAVKGQSLVANISVIAGLIGALTAPLLGATVDQLGRRKPTLLAFTMLLVGAMAALWFVMPPGMGGLSLNASIALLVAVLLLMTSGDVVFNAMLMTVARPREQAAASGMAVTLGNVVSILLLALLLYGFVLPGNGLPFIPAEPLLADPSRHSQDRIIGPLAAAVLLIGTVPLMLFGRDAPRREGRLTDAVVKGWRHLLSLRPGKQVPGDVVVFLLARMFFINGKMALIFLGGVYAAGVMGWGAMELLALGLVATVAGIFGGVFGGWLDERIGPKSAFRLEIAVTLAALVVMLMTRRDGFFLIEPGGWSERPLWSAPIFNNVPDLVYLSAAFLIGVFGNATFASARTLMARLTPPAEATTFFGLYALSASITGWLAPLLVDWATRTFDSQQAGMAPIALLMLLGLGLMFFVRGGARQAGADLPDIVQPRLCAGEA